MPEKTGYPSIDRTHLQGIPKEVLNPKIYPLSILATFLKVNEGHLDEIALDTGQRQYTKQEVHNLAVMAARGLMTLGVTPGSKIAIMTPNCAEGIIMMIAANAIGIQSAVLDPHSAHLDDDIELHQPRALLVSGITPATAGELLLAHDTVTDIIDVCPAQGGTSNAYHSFEELITRLAESTPNALVQLRIKRFTLSRATTLYLQTSGSTGRPKILPFTNEAIFASLIYASNSTGTKTRDESVNRVLCVLPYRFPYAWMTIFVNLMGGNQVVLAPGYADEDIAEYYKYNASYIYGSPMILRSMIKGTPEGADLSSVVAFFSAGSTNTDGLLKQANEFFAAHGSQAEIRTNYGLGEGMCIGTASDGIPYKPGTVGKFYVGPEWLIVDDDGNEVKYGEVGKVLVASKSLCQGYYKNPEETAKAFIERGGKTYFCPGDRLSLAEDGYVTFVGRDKRIFLKPGAPDKINCEIIERALNEVSLVERAAVIVAHQDDSEEYAKAFVVLADGSTITADGARADILAALADLLHDYEMPEEVEFIGEIPLLESGKPNYLALERM